MTHRALLALALAVPAALPAQRITLDEAVRLARRQGVAARAAAGAVEAARWRERAFRGRLLPRLSLTGTAPDVNRSITPVIQPDGTVRFVEQSQMRSTLGLTVSQPITATGGEIYVSSGLSRLDMFGDASAQLWQSTPLVVGLRQNVFRLNARAWDRREQALAADVAERAYVESHEQVAELAAGAFFDLYAAEVAVANAAANAAVNDTLYTLNKGRYEVGKIGENDLLQSELALLRARNALDAARLERERARAALQRVVGLPGGGELTVEPPLDVKPIAVDTALAAAQALRNRAELGAQELASVQADRRVREARLDNWPGASITAQAGLNQTAGELGGAYRSPLDQQRLVVGVEMPLVQWGAGRAAVEAARADRERVAHEARARREALEEEARFTALQLPQARRQLEIAAKADTVAGRRFDVAKNRYVIGRIDIGALYIAQGEKDAATLAFVQALRGYWLTYYRLRRLTLYDFERGEAIRR